MQKLILVRYGTHHAGSINNLGRQEMEALAGKFAQLLQSKKTKVIAADVNRAKESAEVLALNLGIEGPIAVFKELYAAEEERRFTDLPKASRLLIVQGEDTDFLIAVVSREYIEALPSFFITDVLNLTRALPAVSLGRGEAVIIDCREGFMDFVLD